MIALGDVVETALNAVGITQERVLKWLGRTDGDCGCDERKMKLNALGFWASRTIKRLIMVSHKESPPSSNGNKYGSNSLTGRDSLSQDRLSRDRSSSSKGSENSSKETKLLVEIDVARKYLDGILQDDS